MRSSPSNLSIPAALLKALNFAAKKHRDQRRKDVHASPYINHPIEVATELAVCGQVTDLATLQAAILHDTVEDTETTFEELEREFGPVVRRLVAEVSDDKSLPKLERKQRQIDHASELSPAARAIKLADKLCNVRDVACNRPTDWPDDRCRDYVRWAEQVVDRIRGTNAGLEAAFDESARVACQAFGPPPGR